MPHSQTVSADTAAVGPRWPDLFLVGAAHAGTTELRAQLLRHPGIGMAEPEEPHFFSAIRPARRFERLIPVVRDKAGYRALFRDVRPDQLAGEASTSYLWSAEAPARMAAVAPAARIVVLLRDPVERAWAHHRHDQLCGVERRGFLRAIRDELRRPARWGHEPVYLGAGFYADGLERFLAAFGPDQVAVRFSESVGPGPATTARELLAWLGLDPAAMSADPRPAASGPATVSRVEAMLRSVRWRPARAAAACSDGSSGPVLDDTIRRLLEEIYASDVTRVSDLLGVIPPWSITPPV